MKVNKYIDNWIKLTAYSVYQKLIITKIDTFKKIFQMP